MEDVRWLNDDEVEAWKSLVTTTLLLPAYIERQLRADDDLTFFEYHVMAMLSETENHTRRMSDLARVAGGSPSRLSHAVGRMERKGLLSRTSSDDDGRVVLATLTESGWQRLQEAAPAHATFVNDNLISLFSAQEIALLGEFTERINTVIQAAENSRPAPRPASPPQ